MTLTDDPRAETRVYVECGHKRVFACAVDWPGWSRAGKNEALALEALAAYAGRYAAVAIEASFEPPSGAGIAVVERVPGSATTDFGAPGEIAILDHEPLGSEDSDRVSRLVRAAWSVLDVVVAGAPSLLRKGPRGGGRDRDSIFTHVMEAEAMYARKLGVRRPAPDAGDVAGIAAMRADIIEALRADPPDPLAGWPRRYAARRIAWHVLDHAWEIEERSVATSD